MSRYVLDSFAVLAWEGGEPGADHVRALVRNAAHIHWMSVVNVGEVFYKIARERGEVVANETLEWLESLPVRFVLADRDMAVNAARIKANYPLAYADCFAAALAGGLDAAVVTGDPEFAQLERDGVVDIEWLPRPRARR